MRAISLLSVAGLAFSARSALAQDSNGGYPAAAPYSTQPAQPAAASQGSADLDRLILAERQDFGVKATAELHTGPMHGPTPNSIPGGQVITTKGLIPLLANQQLGALVFDILGGPEMIPGARPAVPASQAGSFTDQNQQQFGQYLQSLTKDDMNVPLVFYCLSSHCWMSYNASLRAINMGYKNVFWYRGGIEAWKAAGQQVQPARGGP